MTLKGLRSDIDKIDSRIIELLEKRMEKAILLRRHKTQTVDKERELAVLANIKAKSSSLNPPLFLEDIYRRIMTQSRENQDKSGPLIAFQGMHGAYSEIAAMAWNKDAQPIPFSDFSRLFDAVIAGDVDFGLVPAENSLGGIVAPVNSILASSRLWVSGAIVMPIRHCLLAPPGTDHRSLRVVYSHPQALSQCRAFLARNHLEGRKYFDTAGAAKMVANKRSPGIAAIAGCQAGERYGLEIVKEGIEDSSNNRTRFFVISREKYHTGTENKGSAVFYTDDKAGALFSILEIFAQANINLTRIESLPDKPGDYAIFIDFDGSIEEELVAGALEKAEAAARDFRLLGSYTELKPEAHN